MEPPRFPVDPAHPISAQPALVVTAPCTRCGSPDTELLQRMRRNASGSDDWALCNSCGHAFTMSGSRTWPGA
jgi:hypothetical protein